MTVQTKTITAEELLKMPDDGTRRELVRGKLREMVPAGNRHGYVAGEIFGELRSYVKVNKLGRTYVAETGFKLASDPDTILAPDAAFMSHERLGETREVEGYWPGAPNLVVEVISPNDRHSEVLDKALAWLEAGCQMVLVADPRKRTITVYRSRDDIHVLTAKAGDVVDGADVVPGWRLSLDEVFTQEQGRGLDHERYMRRAIQIAHGNPDAPFGCVIVDVESGEVLAEGLNDAEKSSILHGETAAIMDLIEKRPDADPSGLALYTTAEPCPMCSGAILWGGIPNVVLGTRIETLKKLGLPHIDLPGEEVSARCSFGGFEVVYGVLETECDALFEDLARRADRS